MGDERNSRWFLECSPLCTPHLEMKRPGLDAEALARRSVRPSTMSLLGLVRHLAEIERHSFRVALAGQDAPRLFLPHTSPDGDSTARFPDPRVVGGVGSMAGRGALRRDGFGRGHAASTSPARDPGGASAQAGPISLREVLVEMIHEYARHPGHADLLRERIDGRIGQ